MRTALALLLFAVAAPAFAQVPPAELGQRYIPAPWWMREPVVASLGIVRTELPANRAGFGVRFSAVERTTGAASAAAAAKVRELDQSLRALGAERIRLTTSFVTRPLYEQYREKDGTMVDNQRADKIDRYEVTAMMAVSVRDIAVLERAYRTVIAARPTSIDTVGYSLEPDNATRTWLATEAVRDAARRARLAVEASGGHLGAPKVVDPTGGVCQTQVLAGWPSYVGEGRPTDVDRPGNMSRYEPSVASPPAPAPPPPPPPPPGQSLDEQAAAIQVTLQPPLLTLNDTACVVYALLP